LKAALRQMGAGHNQAGYPGDLLNRLNRCVPKNADRKLIGLRKLVAQRSSSHKSSGRCVMPSRNESARARVGLKLEMPISDDANLLNLQKQVEDFVREAKRRAPSERNELVSTVLDTVARDYFRHAILSRRRRARVSKGRRFATGNP
jgi:hypothetical protein